MINLNKIVNESLVKIETEGYVEQLVESTLKRTLKDVVEDTFRQYSDFGKNLEKHIKENININLDRLGIEGYNGLILTAIKEHLDAILTIHGVDKIKEAIDGMLKDVKEEYTLSEIIRSIKSEVDQEDVGYDDILTLLIERSSSGYYHIYLDEEEKDYKYSCDYQISIDNEGKPYSIELKGKELDTKKVLGGLWGTDALLFKIYSSGAKIVLDHGTDPEDYDLHLSNEDY